MTAGTHLLTDEQREQMLERYGKAYVRVASHPHGFASRRERRAAKRAAQLRNDGRAKVA